MAVVDRMAGGSARGVVTLPGTSAGLADVPAVARAARACIVAGAPGVVVAEHVDVVEETAYALDLVWDRDEPLVVVAGAEAGTAADAAHAAIVALDPGARARRCLVVCAGEIHAAREVLRVPGRGHIELVSPGAGPIGWVGDGAPCFGRPMVERPVPLVPAAGGPPSVAVVSAGASDTVREFLAVAGVGLDGLVLETRAGHVPERLMAPLADVVDAIPVAVVSRTAGGCVPRNCRTPRLGEADGRRPGLLDAGSLTAAKARALLTFALWGGGERVAVERRFRRVAGP